MVIARFEYTLVRNIQDSLLAIKVLLHFETNDTRTFSKVLTTYSEYINLLLISYPYQSIYTIRFLVHNIVYN